jgi:hypothetical protein
MVCSATLASYPASDNYLNSNIRLRTTQAEKTNDRLFPSPCGFLATGGNTKKHHRTPTVKAMGICFGAISRSSATMYCYFARQAPTEIAPETSGHGLPLSKCEASSQSATCCMRQHPRTIASTVLRDDVTLALRRYGDAPPTPSGSSVRLARAPAAARGQRVITQRPFFTAASSLSPSRKIRFSSQPVDFAWNFRPDPIRGGSSDGPS